jgi:hypothetical protein
MLPAALTLLGVWLCCVGAATIVDYRRHRYFTGLASMQRFIVGAASLADVEAAIDVELEATAPGPISSSGPNGSVVTITANFIIIQAAWGCGCAIAALHEGTFMHGSMGLRREYGWALAPSVEIVGYYVRLPRAVGSAAACSWWGWWYRANEQFGTGVAPSIMVTFYDLASKDEFLREIETRRRNFVARELARLRELWEAFRQIPAAPIHVIRDLPRVMVAVAALDADEYMCIVCRGGAAEGDIVDNGENCDHDGAAPAEHVELTELRCGHRFHPSCINSWLEQSAICPFCRTPVALPNAADDALNATDNAPNAAAAGDALDAVDDAPFVADDNDNEALIDADEALIATDDAPNAALVPHKAEDDVRNGACRGVFGGVPVRAHNLGPVGVGDDGLRHRRGGTE